MTVSTIDESQLVAQSLAGDRQAFGRIVARYQNLICSIAYAATGSVAQSEDLAQETFFSAWRQLKELREPAKLRAWLCGIARNLVNNSRRRAVREPTYAAEPIEAAGEAPTPQPPPAEQSISDEEQAILWRSLAEIPEAYREPMVLFYREHRSVESVAEALELSEETVRQRLSRGRKLLHEQVLAFVEGALERSSPGKAFAIAVVAGLPAYTATSSAAAVSVGAAKGGVAAKVAFVAALFNSLLGLLISIPGTFFAVRAALDGTRSTRERAFVARQSAIILLGAAAFTLALVLAVEFTPFLDAQPWAFGVVAVAIPATWTIWLVRRLLVLQRGQAQMRAEDAERNSTDAAPAQEFRSRAHLFGVPLVHIRYGPGGATPVVAWIAIGDRAIGLLFAMGVNSLGTISVGTVSAGLLSIGSVSVGLVSMGGVSLGLAALGGIAVGLASCGGLAVSWFASLGGLAISHDVAMGARALAEHANDAYATAYLQQHDASAIVGGLLALLLVLTTVPPGWIAWRTRRLRRSGK